MLDSPDGVCAGQVRFEYPATSVLFSNYFRVSGPCNVRQDPVRSSTFAKSSSSVESPSTWRPYRTTQKTQTCTAGNPKPGSTVPVMEMMPA